MEHGKCEKLLLFLLCAALCPQPRTATWSNHAQRPPVQDLYEFYLDISQGTLMTADVNGAPSLLGVNVTDGSFYARDPSFGAPCQTIIKTNLSAASIVTGNNAYRQALLVNGFLPGPTIVVYQHSQLVVHVTNRHHKAISMHWHGLDQLGEMHNDGVTSLTQCGIQNGETFVYKMNITNPPGTYWYHPHSGVEDYGAYGALVILDRDDVDSTKEEFVALLSDLFPVTNEALHRMTVANTLRYQDAEQSPESCYEPPLDANGQTSFAFKFHALLVNNRGWKEVSDYDEHYEKLPLERFLVANKKTKEVVFRIINVGLITPVSFQIGGHRLRIFELDGGPIEPKTVDVLLVNPGERFSVLLVPRDGGCDFCEIEVRSTEEYVDEKLTRSDDLRTHKTVAFLSFRSASKVLRRVADGPHPEPTVLANCQVRAYPAKARKQCVHVSDFRGRRRRDGAKKLPADVASPDPSNFVQLFLNIRVEDMKHAINGIQLQLPTHPPTFFARTSLANSTIAQCNYSSCGVERVCRCTHKIDIPLNSVVQLVLYSKGMRSPRDVNGHPMHLHGQAFYVIKQVWPSYNADGLAENFENDILCPNGTIHCNYGRWNASAVPSGIHPPGANLIDPPKKDTIMVPTGGYVIVRFKATNPGWWFFHCHTNLHMLDGMAMILKVGSDDEIPRPPRGMPTCGLPYSY